VENRGRLGIYRKIMAVADLSQTCHRPVAELALLFHEDERGNMNEPQESIIKFLHTSWEMCISS